MDLVLVIVIVAAIGWILYFVLCAVFLIFTDRPVRLALSMAWKLPAMSVLGLPILGFGGVALSTTIFVTELSKLPNYRKVRDIFWAAVISSINSVVLLYSAVLLAFEIIQ